MASSQNNENSAQSKTCRCGEKDTNIWTTTTCENNPDKQSHTCPNCQVFKSGPLFISSKGIGWTSWKKRWFVLTRTSLVFFRSDPNAPPQKGGEGNLTLGGIDLNNSGSVVVRADKKLLTVLFPDGRDGRAFTLKAETSEDLHEWKTALENALMQAPSAALAMGQNGIFRNDMADSIEASVDLWRDKRQVKSLVVGRPILLALEDIDGSPSFLEKALRFIEEYGIKVEGILRQSADVEEVERRVQEYEQGKNEFSPGEDAHVIGDCIKHILRELPSSPVPASSCTALVEAYRTDRGSRVNAMRAAIAETFPEPNRHLVQRILKMMRTVASHKHENRMSLSALAACMAPLLLRPLLAGDCDLEDNFNMGGDGSIQLLQAAAAANHAQAIVIILLEEYEKIFDNDLQDGSLSSDLYSESENGDIDYESTDNDILEDDGYHDADNDHEADIEDAHECTSSGTTDESCTEVENDLSENEDTKDHNKKFATLKENEVVEAIPTASGATNAPLLQQDTNWEPSSTATVSFSQHDNVHENDILQLKNCNPLSRESSEPCGDVLASTSTELKSVSHSIPSNIANSLEKSNEPAPTIRQRTVWGRTSARKNLSMESIDYSSEDEIAIKRLEMTKTELQTKITKEVKGNAILQASLERRKEALHERRLALEQDVDRLQEQLQKERDLRASLESGLMNLRPGHVYITSSMDGKTRADLEEIALAEADIINLKQRVADLRGQLSHELQHGYASLCESCSQHLYARQQLAKSCEQNDVASTSALDQNENLSMTLDGLPGATSEQVQAERRNMHSLLNQELSQEEQTESTSQNDIISSQVNSSSPTAVSTAEAIATTEELSARDENAWLDQHVKTQTQDSPILPDKEPFLRRQIKATSQDSKECLGASSSSHSEETKKVARKATSKRTTSRVENFMMGVDSENKKSQIHDSQISPKKQLPQSQETSKTSSSSNKSIGSKTVSSIEEPELVGQNAVSKKSSLRGENVKNESEDAANRQPSWKQQPNNASLTSTKSLESSNVSSSEEPATVKRNAASRRSSSREEVLASSSSALTRLTNRLNFLKERRVQLANELQNLDNNRTLASEGPSRAEGPPPRTNSR